MMQKEYEHIKKECWLNIANYCGFVPTDPIKQSAFNSVFDTAYAIGKEEKESKSMQLSDVKTKIDEFMNNHTDDEVYKLLKKYGAIEDVKKTTIQGYVARDKSGFIIPSEEDPLL